MRVISASDRESVMDAVALEAFLWECKDYADGWIAFRKQSEALEYQDQTGCLVRIYFRPVYIPKGMPPSQSDQ